MDNSATINQTLSTKLQALLQWWLYELAGLVSVLRGNDSQPRLIARATSKGITLYRLARGLPARLAHLSTDATDSQRDTFRRLLRRQGRRRKNIVLRLAEDQVIREPLTLPAAARDVLQPVIGNQIERLVPWPLSDTVFAYEIADQAPGDSGDQITVNIVATSRAVLERMDSQARRSGITPLRIEFASSETAPGGLTLSSREPKIKRNLATRIGNFIAAGAIAAALVGGAGFYRSAQTYNALTESRTRISEAENQRLALGNRRRQSLLLNRKASRIVTKKTAGPAAMITLEMLSRTLPGSTWLTALTLQEGKMTLAGQATNAAALVSKLEEHAYFEDVQFSAPTTRAMRGRKETYSISARVLPTNTLRDQK